MIDNFQKILDSLTLTELHKFAEGMSKEFYRRLEIEQDMLAKRQDDLRVLMNKVDENESN